ncbi:MAG: DUF4352 domain-containing protein [Bradymonadaceae bacterium]
MALEECTECGEEVSSDATECPNCGTSNPQGTLGGWWRSQGCLAKGCLPLFLLFVVGGVVAAIGSSQSGGGDSSTSSASSGSQKEVKTFEVGESFRLGDFSYAVNKVEVTDEVGNQVVSESAGSGAKFLIVWFTIRNEGKETATVLTDDFKIKTKDGTTFRSSSKANTALSAAYEDKDLMLSELQPGLEKTTATAFQVPEDVVQKSFYVSVPEKGILSAGKVRVKVTPSDFE